VHLLIFEKCCHSFLNYIVNKINPEFKIVILSFVKVSYCKYECLGLALYYNCVFSVK